MTNLAWAKPFQYAALLCLPLAFTACDDDDDDNLLRTDTISEKIDADDRFDTLEDLLDKQDLLSILDDDTQNLTLFAPVNAAFTGVNTASLTDAQLRNILLYHVLGAEVESSAIAEGFTITNTATEARGPNGNDVSLVISRDDAGQVLINGANLLEADIDVDNGVIHAIDKVLTPPSVVGHATNLSAFSSLVTALTASTGDLPSVLSGAGPFTVFAPLNSAFDATTADDNLTPAQLNKVLTYHVIPGYILSTDITASQEVTTVNGEKLTVAPVAGGGITITDARGNVSNVVLPNVKGTNGVIHAIDGLLLPDTI